MEPGPAAPRTATVLYHAIFRRMDAGRRRGVLEKGVAATANSPSCIFRPMIGPCSPFELGLAVEKPGRRRK